MNVWGSYADPPIYTHLCVLQHKWHRKVQSALCFIHGDKRQMHLNRKIKLSNNKKGKKYFKFRSIISSNTPHEKQKCFVSKMSNL